MEVVNHYVEAYSCLLSTLETEEDSKNLSRSLIVKDEIKIEPHCLYSYTHSEGDFYNEHMSAEELKQYENKDLYYHSDQNNAFNICNTKENNTGIKYIEDKIIDSENRSFQVNSNVEVQHCTKRVKIEECDGGDLENFDKSYVVDHSHCRNNLILKSLPENRLISTCQDEFSNRENPCHQNTSYSSVPAFQSFLPENLQLSEKDIGEDTMNVSREVTMDPLKMKHIIHQESNSLDNQKPTNKEIDFDSMHEQLLATAEDILDLDADTVLGKLSSTSVSPKNNKGINLHDDAILTESYKHSLLGKRTVICSCYSTCIEGKNIFENCKQVHMNAQIALKRVPITSACEKGKSLSNLNKQCTINKVNILELEKKSEGTLGSTLQETSTMPCLTDIKTSMENKNSSLRKEKEIPLIAVTKYKDTSISTRGASLVNTDSESLLKKLHAVPSLVVTKVKLGRVKTESSMAYSADKETNLSSKDKLARLKDISVTVTHKESKDMLRNRKRETILLPSKLDKHEEHEHMEKLKCNKVTGSVTQSSDNSRKLTNILHKKSLISTTKSSSVPKGTLPQIPQPLTNLITGSSATSYHPPAPISKGQQKDIVSQLTMNKIHQAILQSMKEISLRVETLEKKTNLLLSNKKDVEDSSISDTMLHDMLPLATYDDFSAFELKLVESRITRERLISFFCKIGGKDEKSCVYNILRRLMKDSLAECFSMSGIKSTKKAFIETNVFNLICASCQQVHEGITEVTIKKYIGDWLSQAKFRLLRRNKNQ